MIPSFKLSKNICFLTEEVIYHLHEDDGQELGMFNDSVHVFI
jgi:hypothetical protein